MENYHYLKISKTKKLRYLFNYSKKNLYIIFLHGFMSNIEGKKAHALKKYSLQNKLGYLAVEYSGHGKSSGKFIQGNITKWSNDIKISIKKILKKNNFILIGSSMGAWIALNIFKYFKNQIKGFIGIGSAPEFTSKITWKNLNKNMKKEIYKKGFITLKNGQYEYPMTYQLIKDGFKNKVLSKKINLPIPVTMIHGSKDESVPVVFSKKILNSFTKAKKKLSIIKNGDHSLSKKKYLRIIFKELDKLIFNIS
ncbi:MAG: alpha/beta hydrolase [Proteobacteria bacterium]|nr:alpha/beta hydrolase [Pseudomonadota bacterium]